MTLAEQLIDQYLEEGITPFRSREDMRRALKQWEIKSYTYGGRGSSNYKRIEDLLGIMRISIKSGDTDEFSKAHEEMKKYLFY